MVKVPQLEHKKVPQPGHINMPWGHKIVHRPGYQKVPPSGHKNIPRGHKMVPTIISPEIDDAGTVISSFSLPLNSDNISTAICPEVIANVKYKKKNNSNKSISISNNTQKSASIVTNIYYREH